MKREEMIDLIIEDRINEWVHARCYEGLEEILYVGWTGYTSYTDQELQGTFMELLYENFDDEKAEEIRQEQLRIKQKSEKYKS